MNISGGWERAAAIKLYTRFAQSLANTSFDKEPRLCYVADMFLVHVTKLHGEITLELSTLETVGKELAEDHG